jgi:predicted phosphoribosyltransferase
MSQHGRGVWTRNDALLDQCRYFCRAVHLHPARIAVPVARAPVCKRLAYEVDEMVCVAKPEPFGGVG